MKKEGSHAKLTKLKDMRIDYEKKGQFSQKVFFPLMVKPAEKSFCTIRRPCIPHKQWFDIIQELMIRYCTKVESSLLQIDPTLWWNFSQTILTRQSLGEFLFLLFIFLSFLFRLFPISPFNSLLPWPNLSQIFS